jgi:putative PIN family toxin of toxin-antitoxin system
MKVIIDTNIIISAIIFPGPQIDKLMHCIFTNHDLVLTSSIINEAREVIKRKCPSKITALDIFLASASYEYQHTIETGYEHISIRDKEDRHVIISAHIAQADVLVTGDKDFFNADFGIEILSPADFMKKYAK